MKKTILITGASRGIGHAIATQLLREGHEVIGLCRSHTLDHENYIPKKIDLSELKSMPDQLKALRSEFPQIDALICNAGVWHYSNFEELSFDEMRHLFDVNFLSHVYLVKTFLPQMKTRKKGDLIFLGSTSASNAPPKESMYAASKSALATFAKSLRSECATRHIRITTIHPGAVDTEMLQIAPFMLGQNDAHHIVPEDIAKLVSYLLNARIGTVLDEIHLSPQTYRLEKKPV